MATDMDESDAQATYEELANIEREFEDVDTQIIAQQHLLCLPLYAKRAATIRKIKHFWPLALESAPPEIDQLIQPSDSEVLAACLEDITLERFEIPPNATPHSPLSQLGNPRSFSVRFEFSENEWFSDTTLEKKFWFRRTKYGEAGLVSEPVRIHWKPAKDLSEGLTDGACALFEAVMNTAGGDASKRFELKEYKTLVEKVENSSEGGNSFFTWFGYKGGWVTAEESAAAMKEDVARMEAVKRGEKVPDLPEPDEDAIPLDGDDAEVFPVGEELAFALAEEFWPNALKYFTSTQEDANLSDIDFEDMDMDMDEDDDDDEDGDIDLDDAEAAGQKINIRNLVKDSQKGGAAAKRRKN